MGYLRSLRHYCEILYFKLPTDFRPCPYLLTLLLAPGAGPNANMSSDLMQPADRALPHQQHAMPACLAICVSIPSPHQDRGEGRM